MTVAQARLKHYFNYIAFSSDYANIIFYLRVFMYVSFTKLSPVVAAFSVFFPLGGTKTNLSGLRGSL